MKKIISLIVMLTSLTTLSYGQKKDIYIHPKFDSIAKNQKELAILPFEVTLKLRPRQMKKMGIDNLRKLEKVEGESVQKAIHNYFFEQKEKEKFSVGFQDISNTNSILMMAGWTSDSLRLKTKTQICQQLNVDGIISGTVITKKPMSEEAYLAINTLGIAASIAANILTFGTTGIYVPGGKTNYGNCVLNIYESNLGEQLWRYEKSLSRSLGSSTNSIINAMMRKASKKFPYSEKNKSSP